MWDHRRRGQPAEPAGESAGGRVPVLAGLLSGRFLGTYTAVVAALVLIVLGLVAGRAMVGDVAINGDRDPLMASEGVAFATEKVTLMPPQMYEDPWLVEVIRDAIREGNTGHILAWLYLMMHWWGPVCLLGPALTFLEIGPRLLAPHPMGLVILWATVAGAVAWSARWIKRKFSTQWTLKVIYVAIGGTALTMVTAVGHWLLSMLFGNAV